MKIADIKRTAAIALSNIDAILRQWLPGGKVQGNEYVALNPTRSDGSAGSFSINTRTGAYSDFATGDRGGDLVSLVAYLDDCSQSEAAKRLAEFLNIQLETDQPKRNTTASKGSGKAKPLPESKKPQEPGKDSGTGDGWLCVMPIPDNAPKPPQSHPRHGKPTVRNEYRAIDGRLNYFHDRYEKQDGEKKQFSPLTLWQKGTVFKWQFKAPTEPRPLYGLTGLAAYPDAVVFVCEGEKSCQALEVLQPNHAVLCWQGGSQAVSRSDYSPLAGRAVVVWPDNDNPGKKAAIALIDQLKKVKAKSIKVLAIDKLTLADNGPLPPGGDCADLLQSGWTAERFSQFLSSENALIDTADYTSEADKDSQEPENTVASKPESETPQRGFEVFESGVFFIEPTRDSKLRRRWICGKLEVLALARTPDNKEWGKLVTFKDYDQKVKRLVVPMRNFNGEGLACTGELLAEGLDIAPKARQLVLEYLQTSEVDSRARLTNRTGWHDNNQIFVMPQMSVGESSEEWLYTRSEEDHFKQRGTLEEWQHNISRLCAGNSRFVLAVSAVFAAPLLRLVNGEGGGIHFRGGSSSGKSTILRVACSVVGSPDYLLYWRSTDSAAENLAQDHNDSLLALDDLAQVDAKLVNDICLMMGNGQGKNRSKAEGGNRKTARWKIMLLSSGEVSLAQHAASVGKQIHAGSEVRINDIEADCGAGMKGLECIHDYESPSKLIMAFNENVNQYYGVAFLAFLKHVLRNQEEIPKFVRQCEEAFKRAVLNDKSSTQAVRVANRFATIITAGELATNWGVTGWEPGEAMNAGITCYKAWLESYGGDGNREERDMISQVRRFIELNGEGRFIPYERADDLHAPKTLQSCGYRKTTNDGTVEYLVFRESFKSEVCKSLDYRAVARLLIDKKYMKPGEGKNLCPKVDLKREGRIRVFHIMPSIWSDYDDG